MEYKVLIYFFIQAINAYRRINYIYFNNLIYKICFIIGIKI